jgi:hypothetical protein
MTSLEGFECGIFDQRMCMSGSVFFCPQVTANHRCSPVDRARDGHGLVRGITQVTYALRACSRALLTVAKRALASYSQVAVGGHRWLLTAIRRHLGDTLVVGQARNEHAT